MQTLRRLYSTLPEAAAAARTASTPRAVRLRRLRKHPVAPGASDATPEGLTPTELARYQRQLAKGDLTNEDGTSLTEGEWLERLNDRRTRVRGVRKVTLPGGAVETAVVAQKIYMPNLVFRLVRNATPPGQAYNPYEATFRIPQSVTKTDVRAYLAAVYGVQTTYIRTDNYLSPRRLFVDRTIPHKTYKRAVVGLVEPFYYPRALEDMSKEEREKREGWIEERFQIKVRDMMRKLEYLRMSRKGSSDWKWRTGSTASRGNILRLIAERRAMREEVIAETKGEIADAREKVLETSQSA